MGRGLGLGAGPGSGAWCMGGSRAESRPEGQARKALLRAELSYGGARPCRLWALDRGGPGKGVV